MSHLKFKNLIYVLFLSYLVVNLLVGATENKISDDPWIRTWFVAGPYSDYEEAKEISDSLSKVNHSDLISFFQLALKYICQVVFHQFLIELEHLP